MYSSFLPLLGLLASVTFIQATGTNPRENFRCRDALKYQRVYVVIETGSMIFAGTDDPIRLFLRDSRGVVCGAADLDNDGNDHERNSVDEYILCCPGDFAANKQPISLLLLNHKPAGKGSVNNWFIENIKVRTDSNTIFEYRFHAWTDPRSSFIFGATRVEHSSPQNKTSSYSFVTL
jgi:hypothetical protein